MRLYNDDTRCTGYTELPTFKFEEPDLEKKCQKADTCERYLQRNTSVLRAPFQNATSTKGCDIYIERKEQGSKE